MRVFIDANIVRCAAGGPHPHREPSARLLERIVHGDAEAVSDSEILQEVLYRFWRLNQVEVAVKIVDQVVQLIPVLLPVEASDGILAASVLSQYPQIEPRDAIHAAVMLRHRITHRYSYDRHFDAIPGLKRLEP